MTLTRKAVAAALLVAALGTLALLRNPTLTLPADPGGMDTIRVGNPTGIRDADRSSVLAALEEVQPGGAILFAPGTYLIGGEIIRVTVPRVTLLGHPEGTTLRGCDPGEFPWDDLTEFGNNCNAIELAAGRQAVRNLTFEHAMWALHIGCCWYGRPGFEAGDGGHLIEGNTFRNSSNGVRVHGFWTEPTIIRNNRFLNNWHSVAIYGNTVHVLDNDIAAPEPEQVQLLGFPGDAIHIGPPANLHESVQGVTRTCENNVIAGNRIDGTTEGIMVTADQPDTPCRHNIIRDNTIAIGRARPAAIPGFIRVHEDTDATVVGVPLALRGAVVDNLIEGNVINGAEGLGIEVRHASRNRIVNNTITGVLRRQPFPGNAIAALPIIGGDPNAWGEANGSAIWLSMGSDENEIVGNTFTDIAAHTVVLEGDRNIVETLGSDRVLDSGSGNRVTQRAGGETGTMGKGEAQDTIRYTMIVAGRPAGSRLSWSEAPDTWAYAAPETLFGVGFPLTARVVFDDAGLPIQMEIQGDLCGICYRESYDTWQEQFELRDGIATWSTPLDHGEASVSGPAYYSALYPAHDVGVLARALLGRADGTLPLLPGGEARLEPLGERVIQTDDRRRTVRHYAVHGLDLQPRYIWLDEDGATFADESSILAGWEAVFADLDAEMAAALAEHMRSMAVDLVPPARERPLVVHGARLFDPETGSVRDGTTIVVEGDRVAAVAADGEVALPPDAEMIDAAGRMVLPGLWEMHAHHTLPPYLELDASLHLAAGVTTARDLGSDGPRLAALRGRIGAGEALGPRILAAGFIEGVGGSPFGVVRTAEEARTAVDRYAEIGYVQMKVYNSLSPDLLRAVSDRARHHRMRVGGHLPFEMTGREAIEDGMDEIHHLMWFLVGVVDRPGASLDSSMVASMIAAVPGTADWERFVELLRAHDVVVDPTLLLERDLGRTADWITAVADRLPLQARRRLSAGLWIPQPPILAERWPEIAANRFEQVKALHEAGVPIVAGSDFSAGFGLQRELELYAEAGIAAHEVLTLATLGAARVMGMDGELGSVEPGKLADLILVDGDPTRDISDIRRVVMVVKDGRVHDPAAIYRALGIRPCCEAETPEVRR